MPKEKKPSRKGRKKYAKPKMTKHGNLEQVAQRITGAMGSSCCVTQRLRESLVSTTARESLVEDLAQAVSAGR